MGNGSCEGSQAGFERRSLDIAGKLVRSLSDARDHFVENVPINLSLDDAFESSPVKPKLGENDDNKVDKEPPSTQGSELGKSTTDVRKAVAAVVKLVDGAQLQPMQKLFRDEIGFVAGIANIVLSAFWLGRQPATFYRWWTVKALILYSLRFIVYRSKGEHYFLLEMCYLVNVVLAVSVWLSPTNVWLYKAAFGLVAGPLTWSIVALRNSLVLHSLDQMTSLFMHSSPALVVWALRWYPSEHVQELGAVQPELTAVFQQGGFSDVFVNGMVLYMLWAVVYYLKIFVISADSIKERGYMTLYSLMTKNKNGAVARVVFSVPKTFQPLVYMLFHALLSAAAMSTAVLSFNSYWAHTALISLMLLGATFNGATYYFKVFAHWYVAQNGLEKKSGIKVE